MVDPLSSPAQRAALVREVTDATVALGHGLRTLGGADYCGFDAGAVFPLLATGCEKLLKLSRGALSLEEDGAWPELRKKYSHRIVELNDELVAAIIRRRGLSTATGYIEGLLDRVRQDGLLQPMLEALQRYATHGRFHHLDMLGGTAKPEDSPAGMWHDLEVQIMLADPQTGVMVASPASYRQGREKINFAIAESLSGWIELYYRVWVTGVFGQRAVPWASDIRSELQRLKTPGW